MKNSITRYSILLFLLLVIVEGCDVIRVGHGSATKNFDDYERDQIADNTIRLINDFVNSIVFDNTLSKEMVSNYKKTFGDSLANYKLDSLKQEKRSDIIKQIEANFLLKRKKAQPEVSNFAFDTTILHQQQFPLVEFAETYVKYYDKVEQGDFPVMFPYGDGNYREDLHPILREMQITNTAGGNSFLVQFEVGWLDFYYDTISHELGYINTNKAVPEFYENSNIKFTSRVFFSNPNDKKTFKFLSVLGPQGASTEIADNEQLNQLIEQRIIKNFELYANISNPDEAPDPSLSDNFIEMINDPNKKSIQCDLFFSDEICGDQTDISAVEYADKIAGNYGLIYPVEITANYDSLELLRKTSRYYLIKLPIEFSIFARDYNQDEILIDKTQNTNLYLKVDYQASILSNEEQYTSVKITDIASYDKEIVVTEPDKMANWSILLQDKPGTVYYTTMNDYSVFENKTKISNSIGVSGQYLWFVKKNGVIDHDQSIGLSLGFFYDNYNASMEFDEFHYDEGISPGQEQTDPFYRLGFADKVSIDLNDFEQTLKYSTISFPVKGHYKINLQNGKFLDLGAGLKFSMPLENSITLESKGTALYEGIKNVPFPDLPENENGTYLITNLPSKGFASYNSFLHDPEPKTNSMLTYLILEPSISLPIEKTIKNGFIDFGLSFQYGFNSLIDMSESYGYLVDSHGETYDVFSNGINKNHIFVGFSIAFRYFDEQKVKSYKTVKY